MANVSSNNLTTLYSGGGVNVRPTSAYGNANVVALLNVGTDGGNTVTNILANGNITANGFIHSQSNLSTDANLSVNGNASINGNLVVLNINVGNSVTTAELTVNSTNVHIGQNAGLSGQGNYSVAVGYGAGAANQSNLSVAYGYQAGAVNQGPNAVAIGSLAGEHNQGANSIAIGANAGYNNQPANSIILNATGSNLDALSTNSFTVKPVRNNNTPNVMFYNNTTGEITYDLASNVVANNANYANYAGEAFNVNVSNVSGIGNIAVINLDGNVSNILHGNGYWGPEAGNLNANYANYAGNLINGTSNVSIPSTNGNIVVGVNGTSNVLVLSSSTIVANTITNVRIGPNAGITSQGANSIAIGNETSANQGTDAINIGRVGPSVQGNRSIALGYTNDGIQQDDAIAIGTFAGGGTAGLTQGEFSIAIGRGAGTTSQHTRSIGIGYYAGRTNQLANSVSIGYEAGQSGQGHDAIAIGSQAGTNGQGNNAVSLGFYAGASSQGINSIAIGANAGYTSQGNNSIILNATGSNLDQTTANTFTVKPVRNANTSNVMFYNNTTGEITYDVSTGITANSANFANFANFAGNLINGTSNVNTNGSGGNISISVNGTSNVVTVSNTRMTVSNLSILANALALGNNSGGIQGTNAISIGSSAGGNNQGNSAIAIGNSAGNIQGVGSIAIGAAAGSRQGIGGVSIGSGAGRGGLTFGSPQGDDAVAIGTFAGHYGTAPNTIAIGYAAGFRQFNSNSIAIGVQSGSNVPLSDSIAIGSYAGFNQQGSNTIAIGANAGYTTQANNSIILNATGANLDQTTANTFTVKPVRNANTANIMYYDNTTGEITYDVSTGITANSANFANYAGNVTVNAQANITSLGNLTSLTVRDNSNVSSTIQQFIPNSATITSVSTQNSAYQITTQYWPNASTNLPATSIIRSRGNSTTPTTVVAGDRIHTDRYYAYNGNTNVLSLETRFATTGVVNGNSDQAWVGGQWNLNTGNPSGNLANANATNSQNQLLFSNSGSLVITQGTAPNTSLGQSSSSFLMVNYGSSTTNLAQVGGLNMQRARGNRDGNLSVEPGDQIGRTVFVAYSNGAFQSSNGAQYRVFVDSTYVANDSIVPMSHQFQTVANVANVATFKNTTFYSNGVAQFPGDITTTGTIIAANANLGNLAVANFFSGDGSLLTNINPANVTRTFGSFTSNVTQTNSNVGNAVYMTLNNDEGSNGVSIVSNSQITIAQTGLYNLQFSAQMEKTDAGTDAVEIWLTKNGSPVANSATRLQIQGTNEKDVAAWNWVDNATTANTYYEIAWASTDANMQLVAIDSANTLSGVSVPSLIVTVVPVGA